MKPSAIRSRVLISLLIAVHTFWLYSLGRIVGNEVFHAQRTSSVESFLTAVAPLALAGLFRSFPMACWLGAVRNARLGYSRPFVLFETLAGAAVLAGTMSAYDAATEAWGRPNLSVIEFGILPGIIAVAVATILVAFLGWLSARGGQQALPERESRFFLWARGHVADREARRYLAAAVIFASLVGAGLAGIALRSADTSWRWPRPGSIESEALRLRLCQFGGGLIIGMFVTVIQGHWLRAIGFVPLAFLLLAVALTAGAIWPAAEWPVFLLGFAGGLAHSPLLIALLASVPVRHRFWTMMLYHATAAVVSAWLIAALYFDRTLVSDAVRFGILAAFALIATIVFGWSFWRAFVEQVNEVVFRPMWYPIAYGPGATGLPTRGPFLIIGNHSAMFDPVWLNAVLPLRSRAMMLSTFMDKPFLNWLTGTVYKSIRVPDEGFRRVMPELDEAVATIKSGESVMIFPEAWIRRKEEQPIRRFAQGVYKILQQVPQTPVIACWIEDGWGTYSSYKNGPPGKGKPFDILKRIRIGVSEPEFLSPETLADDKSTRRYLMQAVLNARAHLGLPAHPMPVYGAEKEGEA